MNKPDVTRDVTELLAWRKAARMIYEHTCTKRDLTKTLIAELNIGEATARIFIEIYNDHKEEIVNNIKTDPFTNERAF